jgi:alpha-tubulin suppressor-like RCC1 family protein
MIGDGTTTMRLSPTPVAGLTNAVAVVAGGAHSCALLVDGTARCWGASFGGQLGNGDVNTPALTPVAVTGLAGIAQLVAKGANTCAVTTTGEAWCWGDNGYGQLGVGTTSSHATPTRVAW